MTNLQALVQEWRRIAKAQWDCANEHDVTDRKYHIHAEAASTFSRCADDLEKAGDGWVKCSERMPEIPEGAIGSVAVLIWCEDGWQRMAYWRRGDMWNVYGCDSWRNREWVSHWRTLPHPPRTGEGTTATQHGQGGAGHA